LPGRTQKTVGAKDLSQEQFGEKRLINIFQNRPFDSTRQTIEAVKSAVASFIGNSEASDDLTVLCLNLQA
jgi:serine phosphatase RsbU (regulator of sigma subunit)